MCVEAASGILVQYGREYGFREASDQTARATDISLLTAEERDGLPTNNLHANRAKSFYFL